MFEWWLHLRSRLNWARDPPEICNSNEFYALYWRVSLYLTNFRRLLIWRTPDEPSSIRFQPGLLSVLPWSPNHLSLKWQLCNIKMTSLHNSLADEVTINEVTAYQRFGEHMPMILFIFSQLQMYKKISIIFSISKILVQMFNVQWPMILPFT